jgi:putative aldouronate transport system substrate-binding protein
MSKKFRFSAALLAVLMVAGTLSGCSSSKKDVSSSASSTSGGPTRYSEQVEIKIPVYDRGTQGAAAVDNNYWTKYVQKNFGDKYNIKVTYVAIPRKSDVDKFNLLLASGTAPDVLFSYDYPTAMAFYNRGALQTISESMLNSYAPNFVKHSKDVMSYGKVGDDQVFLPGTRPSSYNWVTLIRQDWLDKTGLKMPTNNDEYEKVLLKFKELKLGGTNTIPATLSLSAAYYPSYSFASYPISEKDLALYSDTSLCALSWSAVESNLKWQNKLYNEGLYSPEWALDKDGTKAQASFMNGTAGVYGFYLSQNPPVLQTLLKNVSTAKVSVLDYGAPTAANNYNIGRADNEFGMLSGINKTCKHPEAVLMYFDWLSQSDNLFAMENGVEGKTYKLDDNGLPSLLTYTGEERLGYNSNVDYWCVIEASKDFGTDEKNVLAQQTNNAPSGFEYLITDSFNINKENKKYQIHDFLFPKSIAAETKYASTLTNKWQTYQVQLIQCKPTEFDGLYKAAVKDYLASGYQEILDEKTKVYNESSSSSSSK